MPADTQHFKENPYFANKELRKKWALPEGAAKAPADGSITDDLRAFEADDLVPTVSAQPVGI